MENQLNLISVIVPVYKVENYLTECVNSLLLQTYSNLQIILVDDGSPDNCGKMCDDFAASDKRIQVVHKENGGLSDARNAGLSVAKGEFVGFVDSDDFVAPTMYEEMIERLMLNKDAFAVSCSFIRNNDGVYSDFKIVSFENVDNLELTIEEYMKLFLSFELDSAVCNKLFRKRYLNYPFSKSRINEDFLFLYYNCKPLFNTSSKLVLCSKPFYYYRARPDSICKQDDGYMDPLLVAMAENCEEIIHDLRNWNKSLLPSIYRHQEFAVLKAKGQIILKPKSRKKYPEKCRYIDNALWKQLSFFRKGVSLMNRTKIVIFRFAPFLWRIKSEQH